ncbi:MAG: calcium-binding protein [Pseudomonadota bacterium]
MPGAAAIVAGVGLVLSLVDVGFSVAGEFRPDPLQKDIDGLKNKLDALDGRIDDLEDSLDDLGSALLDEFNVTRGLIVDLSIAESTSLARGARDKLFEYRAAETPTEQMRLDTIEDAEDALRDIVSKAEAALSEPGAVAGFIGQLASIIATRIAVAVELEGGAIGKQSIRTALEDVSGFLRTAQSELFAEFESALTYTNLDPWYVDGLPPFGSFRVFISARGESPYGGQATSTKVVTFTSLTDYAINFVPRFQAAWAEAREDVRRLMVEKPFRVTYDLDRLSEVADRLDQLSDGTDAFAPEVGGLVEGTEGNDLLRGKQGDDTLNGFGDNDVIRAGSGNDEMDGGAGSDLLEGGAGNDLGLGGAGNDGLVGEGGNDTLKGGAGNDQVSGGEGADLLQGDAGADLIEGGVGNDRAYGGTGDDTIRGGDGNDRLFGAGGNDLIEGGADNDLLVGGFGNDTLRGEDGMDTLRGGGGRDDLFGGADADVLLGEGGGDALYGDGGDDSLDGGAGADRLFGGSGNDTLDGGLNNDAMFGGWGDDALSGGGNNDRLNGGVGADTLSGGNGFDELTGGGGEDVFVFGDDFARGQDRITDFTSGVDQIALDSAVFTGLGTGTLDPADLQTGPVALGAGPALVYFAGVLSYDADGAGGADAIGIARLNGAPTLEAGDIFLS